MIWVQKRQQNLVPHYIEWIYINMKDNAVKMEMPALIRSLKSKFGPEADARVPPNQK